LQCDLGRPGCQRCAKYGKDCPGYRDQQELVFRTVDPTGSAGTKQKKQHQQRKRKDVATEAEKHSSSSSSSPSSFSGSNFSDYGELVLQPYSTTFEDIVPGSEQDPFAWTIAPSLSQHWTATSVPIVLNVYSSVEFLKDVFRENTTDGPLVWATHLFSRTYVINLQQPTCMSNDSATDSAKELGTYMGKTLSAVATALSTPQGAMRDDIMAAVWMLCNYEVGSAHDEGLHWQLTFDLLSRSSSAQLVEWRQKAPGIRMRQGSSGCSNQEAKTSYTQSAVETSSGLLTV
jgi:hypothetical protein